MVVGNREPNAGACGCKCAQEVTNASPSFGQISILHAIYFLVFESFHEAFRFGVIVRISFAAHADPQAMVLEQLC